MNHLETVNRLNARKPDFFKMLGGRIVAFDEATSECTIEFNLGTEFCHSVNIVQGGFVTTLLDAAMAHCLFGSDASVTNVSSLEIRTSFLEPTRAGVLRAVGNIVRAGYKTAFAEGKLFNEAGVLTATASSVAKLGRAGSGS